MAPARGGGDELRHRLTEIPRPGEIEVDRGKFRREFVTMLPGNQVRRGRARPGTLDAWDSGVEKIDGLASVITTVHQ